jgi:integrase
MRGNLKLIDKAFFAEKPEVPSNAGRKTDAVYGREGHKYITQDQVEALIKSARQNRNGLRDALMISMAYHHGLRVSELVALRWNDVNFKANDIAVNRRKNGRCSTPATSAISRRCIASAGRTSGSSRPSAVRRWRPIALPVNLRWLPNVLGSLTSILMRCDMPAVTRLPSRVARPACSASGSAIGI